MTTQHSTLVIEGVVVSTIGSVFNPKKSQYPTEKAILSWGVELSIKFEAMRSEAITLYVCPFNSEEKRGGVAMQLSNSDVHIH
ncbi:hypothetical protein RND81_04G059100 [Saponaria officinalis]|uniref:Uncharacterized protein n=1 Tax=Saponaria officinalis TaxID=3572 RepID=A0AAW1LI96_SAPOF